MVPEGERTARVGTFDALSYARVLDAVREAVLVDDVAGQVLYANRAFMRLFGLGTEDLATLRLEDYIAPEWRERLRDRHDRRMRGEQMPDLFECVGIKKSGERMDLHVHVMAVYDDADRLIGSQSAIVDVTTARRREERLLRTNRDLADMLSARSDKDYRYLFENAYDAIIIFDPETEIVLEANPTACQMYGLSREQMIGMSLQSVTIDVARGRDAIERTLVNRVNTHFETVHRRPDGSEIVLECNASVVSYAGKPALLSLNRDVTERRLLEEELRHAQRLEAMGQLAGGVAHDFNNILAAILGSAEQLRRLAADEEALAHAKAVIAATKRGARLTRQLLAFGRKQVVHPIHIDLRDRAVETAGWFARLLGDNVRLAIDPGNEPAVVEIDAAHMEQIVLNLAVNARDAMPEGGTVTILVRVLESVGDGLGAIDPLPAGDYVLLSVSDEGTGIEDAVLPRLFDPFFTTKPEGKGTGLGLASVYGIVRQAGGSLRVTSRPGQGATFDVFLPRSRREPAESGTFARPTVAEGSERVLVVEDDDAVRFALERTLRAAGYAVLTATDAGAAERMFSARGPDIDAVVTDVNMPGLSGPQLAARLRAERPELPVVFLSGYVDEEHRRQLGDAPVLEKPVSTAELTSALRALLDG